MQTFAKAAVIGASLLIGSATAHAQYYNYYGTPYYYYPQYNYPTYQYGYSGSPYYNYYPGYGYTYNYPAYDYYAAQSYPAPRAYWDPYVAARPYSDNAGPKAGPHGSP
jgi:hypothetical protein